MLQFIASPVDVYTALKFLSHSHLLPNCSFSMSSEISFAIWRVLHQWLCWNRHWFTDVWFQKRGCRFVLTLRMSECKRIPSEPEHHHTICLVSFGEDTGAWRETPGDCRYGMIMLWRGRETRLCARLKGASGGTSPPPEKLVIQLHHCGKVRTGGACCPLWEVWRLGWGPELSWHHNIERIIGKELWP